MCFIAFTDQSYPDKGWSRQMLSQTSSVWYSYSHACVAESCLPKRTFHQCIWGNSSLLSHIASAGKETECIRRMEQQYPGSPCNRLPASCVEVVWAIPEFWKWKIPANHVIFQWSLLGYREACSSLVEPSFFTQILYTTLYMSLNSRPWQIKCLIVCGDGHLPVNFSLSDSQTCPNIWVSFSEWKLFFWRERALLSG